MEENMSLSPTLDPESPYYLDPEFQSDENQPMVILGKDEEEDNYFIWKNQFLEFLQSKNKTGFVDGSIVTPDPSSPLYKPWKVCNARVKCWLMNSVSQKYQDYIRYAETAQKTWEDLRMIFVPSVELKIKELRLRTAMLRQGGDSVVRYYEKFTRAWVKLSEYDPVLEFTKEAREKEKLYAFLMGLDKGLSYVRTQIMILNPPPSLHQAFAMVNQAESTNKTMH